METRSKWGDWCLSMATLKCVACGKRPRNAIQGGHVHAGDSIITVTRCHGCFTVDRSKRCDVYEHGCYGKWNRKKMGVKVEIV